jgi:hypothetical protein
MATTPIPRVVDNDRDEITVTLNGTELRGWSYKTESERKLKIGKAREYVEGWCDGYAAKPKPYRPPVTMIGIAGN